MANKLFKFEIDIKYSELTISDSELYKMLGFRNSYPNEYLKALIDSMKKELSLHCFPRLGIRITNGLVKDNLLQIDQELFHPGKIIADMLREGSKFAVILASIGNQADEWIKEQKRSGDIMKAFVADTLGSLIAESIVDFAKEYLKGLYEKCNYTVSNSYSPGYCGWNVKEQNTLFRLLPEGICGVELLPSCLMLPLKSISSIVAIGKNVRYEAYKCEICLKKNCYRRR